MRQTRTFTFTAAILLLSFSAASATDPEERGAAPASVRLVPRPQILGAGVLREPLGIDVDERGFVFVADAMAGKVYSFDSAGASLEFERPALKASYYPIDIAVWGTFVCVLDYSENRVLRFDRQGSYLDILISFDQFGSMHPVSLTASGDGRFVTTDIERHEAAVWTPLLDLELVVGEYGWGPGSLDKPLKGTLLSDGRLLVVETGNARAQLFSPSGEFETILEPADGGGFRAPRGIAQHDRGFIFIADPALPGLFVLSPEGQTLLFVDSYDGRQMRPAALALDWRDRLYVADLAARAVLVFSLRFDSR